MSSAPLEEHPLRVVIVDDTADLRELLRFALVRGGMNVVGEAGDGLAGIELVKESAPDVVLLDLSMPVMDGLEALPRIRVLAPEARIIVLSGFGANQMAEKALTIGADGYLQKGASLGRILDHIRDIVDGRSINPVARPAEPQPLELVRPDGGAPSTRVPVQRAEAAPESPVWDALTLAPFGIVEIAAEPPYRVLRINPAAQELFADPVLAGMPLQQASVEIADTVAENRLLGDMDFEAAVAQKPVQVVVRHVGGSLLLYLRTTSDEVGVLRSAIATTAHEIRGPVAVLCAIAEAVTEDDLDPEQQHKLMKSVARQSRMLDGITADLLTAAQIQRGTLRMDAQDIDPAAVIAVLLGDQYADSIE
ncbi:MAG: response regulator, partial [Marmoricola sp.]